MMKKMRYYTKLSILLAMVTMLMSTCDEIDCTLYNTVTLSCGFYAEDSKIAITDTMTVSFGKGGRVLLNRSTKTSELTLPMSYWQETDTLVLTVSGEEYQLSDTLWISKTNTPHFESPDCPTIMFHQITSVACTHGFIDSVTVVLPYVNYAQDENIKVYIHSSN